MSFITITQHYFHRLHINCPAWYMHSLCSPRPPQLLLAACRWRSMVSCISCATNRIKIQTLHRNQSVKMFCSYSPCIRGACFGTGSYTHTHTHWLCNYAPDSPPPPPSSSTHCCWYNVQCSHVWWHKFCTNITHYTSGPARKCQWERCKRRIHRMNRKPRHTRDVDAIIMRARKCFVRAYS